MTEDKSHTKLASFADLEARIDVDPADLVATLRNYAATGAGISAKVVCDIIRRTPLSQDQIGDMLESAEIGREDQLRRNFERDASAYFSVSIFLSTLAQDTCPTPRP